MIKLLIENKIPFIKGALDDCCDVAYLAPEEFTPEAVRHADAMIIRTRTACNAALLDGSRCRFIATATIGTDHIDLEYCRRNGITAVNAPGCNAPAVAQYVMASIAAWRKERNDTRPLSSLTIGVVGVGHVGSIVARWAEQLGMNTLLCDPPRADREGPEKFVSIDEIARRADIITFHTPLTKAGEYPTYHLCGAELLGKVERKPLIINSARGSIADTRAVVSALETGAIADAGIDCWEGEPNISADLLQRAFIATPHIAGYSREGKIRATVMAVQALAEHFNLPSVGIAEKAPAGAAENVTLESIAESYNPLIYTAALKNNPDSFESLRNNYLYRPEVKSLNNTQK